MEFDAFVSTVTSEHALFISALKGIFLTTVYTGNLSPAGLSTLESSAYKLGKTYFSHASSQIDSYAREMMQDGTEALIASLETRRREALDGIRLSVIASIKEITTSARALALGSAMSANIISKVGDKVKAPDGRTWQVEKLVHVIIRDFAYQTMIDRAVDEIVKAGGVSITITYDIPEGHEYDNVTMTLDEFASLRSKIFHINATAKVSPNV